MTTITIRYIEESETLALAAAIERVKRFYSGGTEGNAEIICNERQTSGWLEYILLMKYTESDARLTVGMIQREPGAGFEFHS